MSKHKPETLALTVSLISTLSVLGVFLGDLIVSRNRDLENGEQRLQHFSVMMAEHTARTFEAVDVLLREMAGDLTRNQRDWESWEGVKGWEYIAQRHSRAMPQLRDLIVFDRQGEQRFISTYFPAPHINVADRPYFIALKNGAESSSYGPYVSRNSGRYTYGIARRIEDANKHFTGVAFAATDPSYLQEFCWPSRLSDDFEAVLINRDDLIVASCRPTDTSRHSTLLGARADDVLFGGELRDNIPERGAGSADGYRIAVSPVPGFNDLRIVAAIPEGTLLAGWRSRLIELGSLAALVTGVLIVSALLIRRQVAQMARMTVELAASHELLEQRIHEATVGLAGQKDEAERANKAKSRFLAAASHDLRQPLHALSLFATDLQRQARSGQMHELPRLSEQIAASTALLGELLDSLLDISRLDVAGIEPDIRAVPLGPIFRRLADAFRRAAAEHRIELRFHPTRLWVLSDAAMLERMLANLVSNALRYTLPGGRVLVGARWRYGAVAIEVRDSGVGIAAEHQAAIFAEFYQIGNPARDQNMGLGLGLSIVDRLAKALDTEIALHSEIGAGTCFTLRMRRARRPAEPTPSRQANAPICCVGESEAVLICAGLLATWDYPVKMLSDIDAAGNQTIFIADTDSAPALGPRLSPDMPFIVLGGDPARINELPAGAHILPLPLKPAKLRALLRQLQKTLSKSMP